MGRLPRGSAWHRAPRRAWLVLHSRGHEVVEFDGPVLELMTAGRARLDARWPSSVRTCSRRSSTPSASWRACAPMTRRAGSATRCSTSATSPGSGTSWKAEGCWAAAIDPWRPVASVSRRRGARGHRRGPPGMLESAQKGRPRERPAGVPPGGAAVPALRRKIRARGAGRRQPHDLLVSGMPALTTTVKRVGHKGADLIAPGNTAASFDAALAAGVDMIEFDVLPSRTDGRLMLAHDYADLGGRDALTLEQGLEHLASSRVRGRRARRRPQAAGLRAASARRAACREACSNER